MNAFLHIPTLLVTASVGTFCLAASLIIAWRNNRNEHYILTWSLGYAAATASLVLIALRSHISGALSITLANALLLLSFGLCWFGYRLFVKRARSTDLALVPLGMLVWVFISMTDLIGGDINRRMLLIALIELAYLLPLMRELGEQLRAEPLSALRLSLFTVSGHAALQLLRGLYSIGSPLPTNPMELPNTFLISLMLIGSSLFAILLGLLQLSLISQRNERRFRIAAETDVLTGLANRRSLYSFVMPRLAETDESGALIVLDIDHFKQVNDLHGHMVGDRALVRFAEVLADEAPLGSIAARIGGEEFALYLPGTNTVTAAEVAEHVRRRARDLRISLDTGELALTVSCGVAGVREVGADFEALLGAADRALYRAKSLGRDRVAVHRWRPSTTDFTLGLAGDAAATCASR